MLFIWVAIASHLLFAINSVIDKFLLQERRIAHPAAYAFAIGLLSMVVIVLAPFGFELISLSEALLAFLAGGLFTYALLGLFAALKRGEASRVVPVVGGLVAFATLFFAYVVIGERLLARDFLAFLLLVVGMFLMASGQRTDPNPEHRGFVWVALGAALLFGLSFALTKKVYGDVGFINGLIWTRIGMAIGALSLLISREARQAIQGLFRKGEMRSQNVALFFTGQAVGAVASFLQNYAIALGSVSIVNALQGTQFAFLLMLTSGLSLWFPKVLKEKLNRPILLRKIFAIAVISAGIVMLAL